MAKKIFVTNPKDGKKIFVRNPKTSRKIFVGNSKNGNTICLECHLPIWVKLFGFSVIFLYGQQHPFENIAPKTLNHCTRHSSENIAPKTLNHCTRHSSQQLCLLGAKSSQLPIWVRSDFLFHPTQTSCVQFVNFFRHSICILRETCNFYPTVITKSFGSNI